MSWLSYADARRCNMSWRHCPQCVAGSCALAAANRKKMAGYKGHRFYVEKRARDRCVSSEDAMKKPESVVGGAMDRPAQECDLALRWTGVWEFVTATKWDDGTKRVPGTMLLMFEDGVFKAMLNDKANGRIAFLSGQTWEDLMNLVNDAVRTDDADWRKAKPFKK